MPLVSTVHSEAAHVPFEHMRSVQQSAVVLHLPPDAAHAQVPLQLPEQHSLPALQAVPTESQQTDVALAQVVPLQHVALLHDSPAVAHGGSPHTPPLQAPPQQSEAVAEVQAVPSGSQHVPTSDASEHCAGAQQSVPLSSPHGSPTGRQVEAAHVPLVQVSPAQHASPPSAQEAPVARHAAQELLVGTQFMPTTPPSGPPMAWQVALEGHSESEVQAVPQKGAAQGDPPTQRQ